MPGETKWFYAKGEQQIGPVGFAEIQDRMARAQILRTDMVWHDGMPAWKAAGEVAELMPGQAAADAPTAIPMAVGYYTSTLGIPARAAENLRGHPTPRGDTGDWPLDDLQIVRFEETVKLRKKISAAASLYKSLMALTGISAAVFVPMTLFAALSRSGGGGTRAALVTIPVTCVMVGFLVLYYFAYRATRKSQRWAPITMFVLFILSGVIQTASIIFASQMGNSGGGDAIGGIVVLVFCLFLIAAFAVVSWRAYSAIPKYLTQPAWCQELIVKTGI